LADDHGLEDYDLWCRFAELGLEGVFVPELICTCRLDGQDPEHTEYSRSERRIGAAPPLDLLPARRRKRRGYGNVPSHRGRRPLRPIGATAMSTPLRAFDIAGLRHIVYESRQEGAAEIAVVVPPYNYAHTIGEALASIVK